MTPVLFTIAAGMGSRFGGSKQLEALGLVGMLPDVVARSIKRFAQQSGGEIMVSAGFGREIRTQRIICSAGDVRPHAEARQVGGEAGREKRRHGDQAGRDRPERAHHTDRRHSVFL